MYKNKSSGEKNNICGIRIKELRQSLPEKTSQRRFAEIPQRNRVCQSPCRQVIAQQLGIYIRR